MTSEDQLTIITALRVLADKMDLLINLLGEREGLKNYLGIELVNSLSNPKSNISEKEPELTGNKIYRIIPGSDRWACPDCKYTGDTWFMQKHPCRENRKRK